MYEYNHEILRNEEMLELVKKAQEGCTESTELVIKHNIRLVDKFARKLMKLTEKEELIQEGVMGICEAIEKFDVTKSAAFSTYASIRIRKRLNYYVKKDRTIKIPHWVYDNPEKFEESKKRTEIYSLNKIVGEGIEFEELIGKIDPEIELIEHQDQLERLFESLDAKEKYVIVETYLEKRTLKDIGESLGVCGERVRQIKCSGLQKMRRRGIENGIKFKRFN